MTDTVGSVQYVARIDTTLLARDAKDVERKVGRAGDAAESAGNRGNKSFSAFAKVGLAAVATAAIAVGALLVKNIDNAIKRVDTLNNSNRTFANMGFEVADVSKAMSELNKSILGLPTPLDAAVSGLQLIAGATGDIQKSQKIFSAINNAVIGFGGTTDQVAGAVRQLSQDLAGGVLTAETWNSLLDNGLGPTLNAIAKSMGKTSKELKTGLSDGSIPVKDFMDRLITLNEKGGGGMASLEKIARDATGGISTSFSNMNTAITRGIADIIKKLGSEGIAGTITAFGAGFEAVLKGIGDGMVVAKEVIGQFFEILKPVFEYIGGNQKVMEVFRISLIAIAAIVGVIIIAFGLLAVLLATVVTAAIEIAIWTVERIIEGISWLGDAIAGVIWDVIKFGATVVRVFTNAYNTIANFFKNIPKFFSGLFSSISALFVKVGSTIGNAIGGAFKNAINGILKFATNLINGFIDSINNVVGVINEIPGVDIARISKLPIPQLAEGGIVSSPTLAMIGEGRESEAVIPLSKLDKMISGGGNGKVEITLNLSGILARSNNDLAEVGKLLIESVNKELRARQEPEIGGGKLRSTI